MFVRDVGLNEGEKNCCTDQYSPVLITHWWSLSPPLLYHYWKKATLMSLCSVLTVFWCSLALKQDGMYSGTWQAISNEWYTILIYNVCTKTAKKKCVRAQFQYTTVTVHNRWWAGAAEWDEKGGKEATLTIWIPSFHFGSKALLIRSERGIEWDWPLSKEIQN